MRSMSISSSSTTRILATGDLLGDVVGTCDRSRKMMAYLDADAGQQLLAVKRSFVQDLGHAAAEPATVFVIKRFCCHHDNGNVLAVGPSPQPVEEFKPVHVGHEQI